MHQVSRPEVRAGGVQDAGVRPAPRTGGIMRKLIQGTVLLAVIVLVACEEAAAPSAASSIIGEWEVTEYLKWDYNEDGEVVQFDYADLDAMTLIYTEDRFVFIETGTTLTGSYEVLSDTRLLLEPTEGSAVIQYSLPDASTLILKLPSTLKPGGMDVLTAKRMR